MARQARGEVWNPHEIRAVQAYAAYVDLNPVRAAIAKTPESSKYTGAKDRIDDLKEKSIRSKDLSDSHQWERSQRRKRSRWMSPIEIDQRRDRPGANPETNGKRASRKGFLSISLKEYLNVLDWTGRQIKKTKGGSIPKELSPILDRIGIQGDSWCELVSKFGRIFKRAAGTSKSLGAEANRRNQNWMHSPGSPLTDKT